MNDAKCAKLLEKLRKELDLPSTESAAKEVVQNWALFDPDLLEYATKIDKETYDPSYQDETF